MLYKVLYNVKRINKANFELKDQNSRMNFELKDQNSRITEATAYAGDLMKVKGKIP